MVRMVILGGVLLSSAVALAQNNAINWRRDPGQAVAEAQRSFKPLMVFVLASERYRDDQIDREQKRSFRNPRVMKKAEKFVPLRLSRAQHRQILHEFGLPEEANMIMSFVAPDGTVLGQISAQGIAQDESLLQKMSMIFDAYGRQLYEKEIKPVLTDEETKSGDLDKALTLVAHLEIGTADQDLLKLLERPRLATGTKRKVYELLALLSTKPAVDKLLELAAGGDALATGALEKCNPVAAEMMISELKADEEPFNYLVYEAVTKICRVPDPKPEPFFENSPAKEKQDEVERVKNIVRGVAQRWKAFNE
jgi:hypothetical protein